MKTIRSFASYGLFFRTLESLNPGIFIRQFFTRLSFWRVVADLNPLIKFGKRIAVLQRQHFIEYLRRIHDETNENVTPT